MYSAMLGIPSLIGLLLELGSEIDAQDNEGFTAVMLAVKYASPCQEVDQRG